MGFPSPFFTEKSVVCQAGRTERPLSLGIGALSEDRSRGRGAGGRVGELCDSGACFQGGGESEWSKGLGKSQNRKSSESSRKNRDEGTAPPSSPGKGVTLTASAGPCVPASPAPAAAAPGAAPPAPASPGPGRPAGRCGSSCHRNVLDWRCESPETLPPAGGGSVRKGCGRGG